MLHSPVVIDVDLLHCHKAYSKVPVAVYLPRIVHCITVTDVGLTQCIHNLVFKEHSFA